MSGIAILQSVKVNPAAFADVSSVADDTQRFGVIGVNFVSGAFGFLGGSDLAFHQHAGVYGESDQQGVMGLATKSGGTGVFGGGTAAATGGQIGVRGETVNGTGVQGRSFGGNGNALGFLSGKDPLFHGAVGVYGESEQNGVFGRTASNVPEDNAVYGQNDGAGHGVAGVANTGIGVFGTSAHGLAARFEGDVEVTGDIRLVNADLAEDFSVAEAGLAEPGTVMTLSLEGELHPCHRAYDKGVVGVISGAGEYKPAIVLDNHALQTNRRPIALVGKVYCKVDARYGAIEVGDLLTTSSTPGHAMKADRPSEALGSLLGKALRPLREGQDLIPILVALQ